MMVVIVVVVVLLVEAGRGHDLEKGREGEIYIKW